IPLTLFRSSALRNGRAAIIRAAVTWPMPGTVVSSFSVAVLMSILPSGVFSFACDFLASPALLIGVGFAEALADEQIAGVEPGRGFSPAVKTAKTTVLGARTFSRPALMPQAPIFSCFA